MTYSPTIGLEIHVELKTRTKMFCDSLNDPDETHPNINVCPVCMAHPGTLPVINREAIRKVIQVGLALNGNISEFTQFERKNYFYPDLPKGYQISQYQHPLVRGGYLEIDLPNPSKDLPNPSQINSNDSRIVLKDESYRLMRLLFEVHNKLGPIYKEKNYCDAIEEVLKRERIPYEREKNIVLKFENLEVSDFFADFVVDNKILLEVKAKPFITNDDLRQASRYINSLGIPLAIVVNFKRQKLESKRVINPAFENHYLPNDSQMKPNDSRIFEKNSSILEKHSRKIRIRRVHLEEDTGRLIHDPKTKTTLVDFNRAGIPLMELVTEPDCHSAEEARLFAEELKLILQYLGVSDADMEKGQMRIEANVSLRPLPNDPRMDSNESRISKRVVNPAFESNSGSFERDSRKLGTKVEIKNINSFKFAADAIEYEIKRQTAILERGEKVVQETRGWDEKTGTTVAQRSKEESHDYRYFPEPDLPPLRIESSLVEELRQTLPELPQEKLRRFRDEFKIDSKLAAILVSNRKMAGFFEAAVSELQEWLKSTGREAADIGALRLAANYLTTDAARLLAAAGTPIQESLITPENFAELITYLTEKKISSRTAKIVLEEMFRSGADPSVVIEERKLWQVSETGALDAAVEQVIAANEKAVADYRAGKTAALQFLVGQVMKEAHGANPETVRQLLEKKLS